MTADHLQPLPPRKVRRITDIAASAWVVSVDTMGEIDVLEVTRAHWAAVKLANALGMIDQRLDLALLIGKELKGHLT